MASLSYGQIAMRRSMGMMKLGSKWCGKKIRLEIGFLHNQRDQVLACDSDLFPPETTTTLHTYLDVTLALQMQNWLSI
jgi:hypothetical protein